MFWNIFVVVVVILLEGWSVAICIVIKMLELKRKVQSKSLSTHNKCDAMITLRFGYCKWKMLLLLKEEEDFIHLNQINLDIVVFLLGIFSLGCVWVCFWVLCHIEWDPLRLWALVSVIRAFFFVIFFVFVDFLFHSVFNHCVVNHFYYAFSWYCFRIYLRSNSEF